MKTKIEKEYIVFEPEAEYETFKLGLIAGSFQYRGDNNYIPQTHITLSGGLKGGQDRTKLARLEVNLEQLIQFLAEWRTRK